MKKKFENGEIRADGKRREPNIFYRKIISQFAHISICAPLKKKFTTKKRL